MIITVKKNASKEDIRNLIKGFENRGLSVTEIQGESFNVFGLVGDTSKLDERLIKANPFLENITRKAAQ